MWDIKRVCALVVVLSAVVGLVFAQAQDSEARVINLESLGSFAFSQSIPFESLLSELINQSNASLHPSAKFQSITIQSPNSQETHEKIPSNFTPLFSANYTLALQYVEFLNGTHAENGTQENETGSLPQGAVLFSSFEIVANTTAIFSNASTFIQGDIIPLFFFATPQSLLSITQSLEESPLLEIQNPISPYLLSINGTGQFSAEIHSIQSNETAAFAFEILPRQTPLAIKPTLSSDKDTYLLNETVILSIVGFQNQDILTLSSETAIYNLLSAQNGTIQFSPKEIGTYTLILERNTQTLASLTFHVTDSSEAQAPQEPILIPSPIIPKDLLTLPLAQFAPPNPAILEIDISPITNPRRSLLNILLRTSPLENITFSVQGHEQDFRFNLSATKRGNVFTITIPYDPGFDQNEYLLIARIGVRGETITLNSPFSWTLPRLDAPTLLTPEELEFQNLKSIAPFVFLLNETPAFHVDFTQNFSIERNFFEQVIGQSKIESLVVFVDGHSQNPSFQLALENLRRDEFQITIRPNESIAPGLYLLVANASANNQTIVHTQLFSWGIQTRNDYLRLLRERQGNISYPPPASSDLISRLEGDIPQERFSRDIDVGRFKVPKAVRDSKNRELNNSIEHVRIKRQDAARAIADVRLNISTQSIRQIDFTDLEVVQGEPINLRLEDLPLTIDAPAGIVWEKAFAIDPTSLNFTNATVEGVAQGRALYKCAEWDFFTQSCMGTWQKVQDLTPGEPYTFIITPNDPGYAESGLASINTNKSLYRPNEEVGIIAVVLDMQGYLVSDANVTIEITSPSNQSYLFSTDAEDIVSNERGIYEALFTQTPLEGNYTIIVDARAENVNNSMVSYFTVQQDISFDIIRKTPATTDPFQSPFNTTLTIFSYTNATQFNLTEELPINFTIVDAGGAIESLSQQSRFLSWSPLSNGSSVQYIAQPPLVTPELWAIGPAVVGYSSSFFTEARPWFLAIDPALIEQADGYQFHQSSTDAPTPLIAGAATTLLSRDCSGGTCTSTNAVVTGLIDFDDAEPYTCEWNVTLDFEMGNITGRQIKNLSIRWGGCWDGEAAAGNIHCDNGDNPEFDTGVANGNFAMYIYNGSSYENQLTCVNGGASYCSAGNLIDLGDEGTAPAWGNADGYNDFQFIRRGNFTNSFLNSGNLSIRWRTFGSGCADTNGNDDLALAIDYANLTIEYDSSPNVTLHDPDTPYYNYTDAPALVRFNCTVTDDVNATNVSLYLTTRLNTSFQVNDSCQFPQANGSCAWIKSLDQGNYTWNCLAQDSFNTTVFAIQNGSILISIDRPPRLNATLNGTSFFTGDGVNITANISDDVQLSGCQFIHNGTASGARQGVNKTVSGTNDQCSQNFTISLGRDSVINFTVIVNDTLYTIAGGQKNQSSHIITLTNTPPSSALSILYPTNETKPRLTPLALNVTFPSDIDGDSLLIYYYINGRLNQTSFRNTTLNASEGTYILNVSLFDGISFGQNSTVQFTIDAQFPNVTLYSPMNRTFTQSPSIFNFTAKDNLDSILLCNLTINSLVVMQDLLVRHDTFYLANYTLPSSGLKSWNVTCQDDNGNTNTSRTANFTHERRHVVASIQTFNTTYEQETNVTLISPLSNLSADQELGWQQAKIYPLIQFGNASTSNANAIVNFSYPMKDQYFAVILTAQSTTQTVTAMYTTRTNTSFGARTEDAAGNAISRSFDWMIVPFGEYELNGIIIKAGNGTTVTTNPQTITFQSPMPNTNYTILSTANDDTADTQTMMIGAKTTTGFVAKMENDASGNEPGDFTWVAISMGEYALQGVDIRASNSSTNATGRTNVTHQSPLPTLNYVALATARDEDDTQNMHFEFKNLSQTGYLVRDDGAAFEAANFEWLVAMFSSNITLSNYSDAINYTFDNEQNYTKISDIRILLEVNHYNATGSDMMRNTRPDLEVLFYNGSNYTYSDHCDLESTYGAGRRIRYNCSIVVTNSTITSAWNETNNRRVQVRGIELHGNDTINWTSIHARIQTPSKIENFGDYNQSGRLLLDIQTNITGAWLTKLVIYNATLNLSANQTNSSMNLSNFWTGWRPSLADSGLFRARVQWFDANYSLLQNFDGTYAQDTYFFSVVDGGVPSVILNAPVGTTVNGTTVRFNFTAIDNTDTTLNCYLLVNGRLIATNIQAPNGSRTFSNITGLKGGLNYWNVTCTDDNGQSNTSLTANFTYLNTQLVTKIQTNFTDYFQNQNVTLFARISNMSPDEETGTQGINANPLIQIGNGTTAAANPVTIELARNMRDAEYAVIITPIDSGTTAVAMYGARTNSSFAVRMEDAGGAALAASFDWMVVSYGEHEIDGVRLKAGNGTTASSNPSTITFQSSMGDKDYAILSTAADEDDGQIVMYGGKAAGSFTIKMEDDAGNDESGGFTWVAIEYGEQTIQGIDIKAYNATTTVTNPVTVSFNTAMPSQYYSALATAVNEDDTQIMMYQSKSAGSMVMKMEADNNADEAGNFDWVAVSYASAILLPNTTTSFVDYDFDNNENYTLLSDIRITIETLLYNLTGSHSALAKPDLEVRFYNGSDFIFPQSCDLASAYGTSRTLRSNCTLVITNSSILSAWANNFNRKIRLQGINFTAENNTINWTSVYADIHTPSELENYGLFNQSGRLVLEVQYQESGVWRTKQLIYNASINLSSNQTLNLTRFWDGWRPSLADSGTFQARVALYDDSYSLIQNADGSFANHSYAFSVNDAGIPSVILNSPINAIVNTSIVRFNFTVVDNTDTVLECSLLANGRLMATGIIARNGSYTLPNITGLRGGPSSWNVTCTDDFSNANTSLTSNFTYNRRDFILSIQSNQSLYSQSQNVTLFSQFQNITLDQEASTREANSSSFQFNYTFDNRQNYSKLSYFDIIIEVFSYNASDSQSVPQKPDLEIFFYNGSNFSHSQACDLQRFYPGMGGATPFNCTIRITNQSILDAWNTTINRNITIRGINFTDINDAIHWRSVHAKFSTPSLLENFGYYNQSGRLVLEVQSNITGSWRTVAVMYNQTISAPANQTNQTFNLSRVWDGWVPGTSNSGFHRAVASLYDPSYTLYQDGNGANVSDYSLFYVRDVGVPSVVLNSPLGYTISTPSVIFNYTAIDNSDPSLSCNVSIDGVVAIGSVQSQNGTHTAPNVSGIRQGFHYWNVSCVDNDGNLNTSLRGNFTYDRVLISASIQTSANSFPQGGNATLRSYRMNTTRDQEPSTQKANLSGFIQAGNGTTAAANPVTITLGRDMGTPDYAVIITPIDSGTTTVAMYDSRTPTSFSAKLESDGGGDVGASFTWLVVPYGEYEWEGLRIKAGNGTTAAANPSTITFSSAMPNVSYSALATASDDGDDTQVVMYGSQTASGFAVRMEDDAGGAETGGFTWVAMEFGEYSIGGIDLKALNDTTSSSNPVTLTFASSMPSDSYAALATGANEDDTQIMMYTAKTAGSVGMRMEADNAAAEVGNFNWVAIQYASNTSYGLTSNDPINYTFDNQENYSKLADIEILINVTYYNATFSQNYPDKPDLLIRFSNGSNFTIERQCGLPYYYGVSGKFIHNCSIKEINSTLLRSWNTTDNRLIQIQAINLHQNDTINWTSVRARLSTPSKIENYGLFNQSGRLVLEVQRLLLGNWLTRQVIFNETINLSSNQTINLSDLWDGWMPTLSDSGLFRAALALYDGNYTLMRTADNALLNDTYLFTVTDAGEPSVVLNSPINTVINTSTVRFNFTAIDNTDTMLDCFMLVNGRLSATNIRAPNGSFALPNITGLRGGPNSWNVTCVDDNGNQNTSLTSNFTYNRRDFILSIQTNYSTYAQSQNVTLFAPFQNLTSNFASASEANSSTYLFNYTLDNRQNYSKLSDIEIIIELFRYNASDSQSVPQRPDIEVSFYNGTNYTFSQVCDAQRFYSGVGGAVAHNCTIRITNQSVLDAWNSTVNRNLTIRAINLSGVNDAIHWRALYAKFSTPSELENFGYYNQSGRLVLEVQSNSTGSWRTVAVIYNQTVNVPANQTNQTLNLTRVWDGWVPGVSNSGFHRALASFYDPSYTLYQNGDSTYAQNSYSFLIADTTSPLVLAIRPAGSALNTVNTTFYFNASDTSALASCTIIINSKANTTSTLIQNGLVSNITVQNMSEGFYNWSVNCTDAAGNIGNSTVLNVTIDLTRPSFNLSTPLNGQVVDYANVDFNFTVFDNYDNNLSCNLTLDGVITAQFNATNGSKVNITQTLTEAAHYWNLTCVDDAQNVNKSETRQVIYDVSNPTVSLINPPNESFTRQSSIPFYYLPSDLSLSNCSLIINGVLNKTNITPTSGSVNSIFLENRSEGKMQWSVNCTDIASRVGASGTYTLYVDFTPPNTTLTAPEDGYLSNRSALQLNFTVRDNLDPYLSCNLSINGVVNNTAIINVSNASTLSYNISRLNDGTFTWNATCRDDANNTNVSLSRTFFVSEVPSISLLLPQNNTKSTLTNRNFTILPRDNSGQIANCTLILNDRLNATRTTITSGQNLNLSVSPLLHAQYNWSANCTDVLGNQGANTSFYTLYIDTLPPYINLTYPPNAGVLNTDDIDFNFTPTDQFAISAQMTCNLTLDGSVNRSNILVIDGMHNITRIENLSEGLHYWNVTCKDDVNNTNVSPTYSFNINAPDLMINATLITFNNTNPSENQSIGVNATIYNIGGAPANDFRVQFYDSGVYFANVTVATIPLGGNFTVNVSFNATRGLHRIFVLINYTGTELLYANNNATNNLSLLLPEFLSPHNGTWTRFSNITLNFTVSDFAQNMLNYTLYLDGRFNATSNLTDGQYLTSIQNLSEGYHSFILEGYGPRIDAPARELSQTRKKNSSSFVLIADYTAPIPLFLTQNNSWVRDNTPEIRFNITDNLDDILNFTVYVDGVANQSNATLNATLSLLNLSELLDGPHNLTIEAVDEAGNRRNSSYIVVYVDTGPPYPLILTPNGTNFSDSTPEIQFNISENLSPIINFTFFVDNIASTSGNATSSPLSRANLTSLGDGDHIVVLQAVDLAGNRQNYSFINITIDTTPPQVTIDYPIEGSVVGYLVQLLTSITDAGLGVSSVSYTLYNSTPHFYQNGTLNFSTSFDDLWNSTRDIGEEVEFMPINFTVSANDTLGNSINVTRQFIVDNKRPTIQIVVPNGQDFNRDFNLDVRIQNRNLTYSNYSIANRTFDMVANRSNSSINTAQFNWTTLINISNLSLFAEGTYNITVFAQDAVNNNRTSYALFRIDREYPNITLLLPPHLHNTTQTDIEFNFTVSDNFDVHLSCNLSIDASVYAQGINATNRSITNVTASGIVEGSHTWNVSCEDNAGNLNLSPTRTFTVDRTAPSILLESPQNNSFNRSQMMLFSYVPYDNYTIVKNCTLVLNNQLNQSNSTIVNGASNTLNVTTLYEGRYLWTINCSDGVGNIGTNQSARLLSIDFTNPSALFLTANGTWFNVATPTVAFNLTDNFDLILNYSIYIDGVRSVIGHAQNASFSQHTLPSQQNGSYVLILEAYDDAYNLVNSTNITIWVDTFAPNITLFLPQNGSNLSNQTVLFSFNASDNLDYELLCNLSIDGQVNHSNISILSGINFSIVSPSPLDFGYHNWSVNCMDNASNVGYSATYFLNITPPDLAVYSADIRFNQTLIEEFQNITIFANISNIGRTPVQNALVQFFLGDPDNGGSQINGNISLNLSVGQNQTVSVITSFGIGVSRVFVQVDRQNAIIEEREDNNKANRTLNVSAYNTVFGNITGSLLLQSLGNSTIFSWEASDSAQGTIFVVDSDSRVLWGNVTALGVNTSGGNVTNDFVELDFALNMTNVSDSINRSYTQNGMPITVSQFIVFSTIINNTPLVNSTNNSNFQTAILWDKSDVNFGQYNGSQDVIFASSINRNTLSQYGTYDFEVRVPARLRQYKVPNAENSVTFYAELK